MLTIHGVSRGLGNLLDEVTVLEWTEGHLVAYMSQTATVSQMNLSASFLPSAEQAKI
jgi:hypothetical protein